MSKIYFGEETEQAIRDYLKCENETEKQLIYLKRIRPAFSKLTENIINMPKFNFKKIDSFQNLHNEVMSHMYSNLGKFNPRRRSKKTRKRVKAFSYFGTVAKNYLVQLSIKRGKTNYLSENSDGTEVDFDRNLELVAENFEDQTEMYEFLNLLVEHFENHRESYSINKQKISDAIVYFLKNSQKETIYNKKHFYLLLRELTGLSSKQITVLLNDFKKEYEEIREQYYEKII